MLVVLFVFLGALMGHLLDLFLDRAYGEEEPWGAFARCPSCRSPEVGIPFLVPLWGYLWYRGRCDRCGELLPRRALLLPPGGAALFVLAYYASEGNGAALLAGTLATLFLALAVTDLERRLIPNRIVYPAMLLAAAFAWAWPDREWWSAFAGGAAALALMLIIYAVGRGALGFGDVKMAALLGLAAGLGGALAGLLLGAIAAGLSILILLALRLVSRRDYIPYGPFIALGGIIAILWGGPIVDWYRG